MYERPVHSFASRTSAIHAWLRLTLAVFVLALFTAGALSSGVAHADDGASDSGGASSATSAPASQRSESDGSGTETSPGPTPGPGRRPGVRHPVDGRGSDTTSTDSPTVTGTVGTAETTDQTPPGPTHTDTIQPTPSLPVGTDMQEHSSSTVATTAPEPSRPTITDDALHRSKRSGQPASVAPPTVPAPQPVTVAPILRSVRWTAAPEPVTPTVAAVTPLPSVATIQPRLGLQVAGLAVDVATVTVSSVHTAATLVAQAFGPSSFLGVPYLLATTVANAAAAVGRTLVGAPMFAPTAGPFPVTYGILDGLAFFNPTKPPAGANDPSITVTPEHPLPVILLNGTTATQGANWSVGAPVLANAGYKVYTFNYGNTTADPNFPIQSIADIRQSGLELAAKVDEVLAETGAEKVILIGHSQGGGILPVYYLNELGGAAKVSQLIGIAPSNHGTDFDRLIALQSIPILGALFVGIADVLGPALYQQAVGSPFQQEVYGNGDTRPGVLYTTIASVNDEVVTPYTQQALTGPNVTNIVLQERYPGLVVGHANIFTSPQALAMVLDALASNPAANPLPRQNTVAA